MSTAKNVFTFDGCTARKILKKHGPYMATMRVYEDFLTYQSGEFCMVLNKLVGQYYLKIVERCTCTQILNDHRNTISFFLNVKP